MLPYLWPHLGRLRGPVLAYIAGFTAPPGKTMGHAGALVHGSHGSYAAKKAALEDAGVEVFSALDEMVAGIDAWHGGLDPASAGRGLS